MRCEKAKGKSSAYALFIIRSVCGECRLQNMHVILFCSCRYFIFWAPNQHAAKAKAKTKRNNEQFRKLNNWKCDSNKTWNDSQLQRQRFVFAFAFSRNRNAHVTCSFSLNFQKSQKSNNKTFSAWNRSWVNESSHKFTRSCVVEWRKLEHFLWICSYGQSTYFWWLSQNKLEIRHKSITLKSDRVKSNVSEKLKRVLVVEPTMSIQSSHPSKS